MRCPRRPLRQAVLGLAAAAVVALPACGSSDSGATAKGNAAVSIKGFEFLPNRMVLPVETDLRVTNEDEAAHTLTADDNSFDTGNIDGGGEATLKLARAGQYPYHCAIHDSMRGFIEVRGQPTA